MSDIKANRTRNLRYKRPALASLGYDALQTELWDIREACNDVHWFVEQGDETLLNALDGDDEAEWEFRMAFSNLEAKVDELEQVINDYFIWSEHGFERTYNDCTVALIGNRYRLLGWDSMEEDYFALTSYDQRLAQPEAGQRPMRKTKAELLPTIGQCFGILLAFLDLRQQYDYLKATFDILRDENTSLLKQIKEIETAYEAANETGWYSWYAEVKRFDQLLDCLPDRAWIE